MRLIPLKEEEKRALPLLKDLVSSQMIETLFDQIFSTEEVRKAHNYLFTNPKRLKRLKDNILQYLSLLLSDPFSEELKKASQHIGHVHANRKVDPSLVFSAMVRIHNSLVNHLNKKVECPQDKPLFFTLLSDLFFYSMGTIIKAYFVTHLQEREKALKEISRFNRLYLLLREINQLIFVERESTDKLFQDACNILQKDGGFQLVWIGLIDHEKEEIIPVAAAGERKYLTGIKITTDPDTPEGRGPTALAIRTGEPVVIEDTETDSRFEPWRKRAKNFDLRSMAALPLILNSCTEGALNLYSHHQGTFTENEAILLKEISRDISLGWSHIEKSKELEKTLFYDEVTGLGNEKHLIESLKKELELCRSRRLGLSLFTLDIKGFSLINRELGFGAGDSVLRILGTRLMESTEGLGTVARIGPDEFALSHEISKEEEVVFLLERLGKTLEEPAHVNGKELRIRVNIGVARYPQDGETSTALLEASKMALKLAKERREEVVFYNELDAPQFLTRFKALKSLEKALKKEEFVLHYQPKISLASRKVSGFEALIRWHDPERGLILPGEFIPLLEDSGLIVEVGRWVAKECFFFVKRLIQRYPETSVAFNVSPKQLPKVSPHPLEKLFQNLLEETGVPSKNIEVEITESAFLEIGTRVKEFFNTMHSLGVGLTIDDFGTGYSSFSYLRRLPSKNLKIDHSFVKGIPDERESVEIVMAIVALAKNLGKKTVAEGVETKEQLAFLTGLGVSEAQGFYFARPMPEEEALEFIDSWQEEKFFWSG